MAQDSKKGTTFSLSSTGMIALALAVFGLIWSGPSTLIAERPGTQTASNTARKRIQDVDARMWQDPLGAIQKNAQKPSSRQSSILLKKGNKNELTLVLEEEIGFGKGDHSPEETIHHVFDNTEQNASYLMLAVMLPGSANPEDEEKRRRERYAVLSALNTLEFAPKDPEAIGYFRTTHSANGSAVQGTYLPETVPFEVFGKREKVNGTSQPRRKWTVVVLWLNDKYLEKNIRATVGAIFSLAQPKTGAPNIRHAVIGPNKTFQLRRFIRETSGPNKKPSPEIEFFAAEATAAPGKLLDDSYRTGDRSIYRPADGLWRTIGNDRDISNALVKELGLRQVNPGHDHVLLVSEWDTLYGRSFPKTFIEEYIGRATGKDVNENAGNRYECAPLSYTEESNSPTPSLRGAQQPQTKVHCINYMRGIDGLLPKDSGKDPTQDTPNKPEAIQVNNNIDRPAGNHQKDYLRRLVDQVRKLDERIRNNNIPCPVRNNGISAIGVVGSDTYDKLMIMQALRPYFPGKIFFTTDLDAAYFSAQELPYTHNLIVGSSFGLSLAPELQTSIPPFRDSYQTAVFFSTILATTIWDTNEDSKTEKSWEIKLTDNLHKWLFAPRIFEIGRKGPVDLSQNSLSDNPENCRTDIRDCNHIHPQPDIASHTKVSGLAIGLQLTALILGLLLLYRVSWTFRWLPSSIKSWADRLRERGFRSNMQEAIAIAPAKEPQQKAWAANTVELLSMLPLVAAGLVIVGAVTLALRAIAKDEPFYWADGVSIWPSTFLTSFSILLSVAFYFRIRRQLEACDKKLEGDFALNGGDRQANSSALLTVHAWKHMSKSDAIDVKGLWSDYLQYGNRSARFRRSALNTAIFILFGMSAIMLSGGLPVPVRGNGFYFDVFIELACSIAVVFLIMWIVDAARLFSKFISLLAEDKKSDWPNLGDKRWGWPAKYEEYSAYWMDIQFVAQYTKAMERFIWYPIPPLLLIGAARSSVFDNWTFSPGLLATIAILLVYLFSIAFILQYGAKEMRTKAVKKLEGQLRALYGQSEIDEKDIAQLEKMIREIKTNEEGAFTHFLHQPMVQALLAFLSGSGGLLVLLERFF